MTKVVFARPLRLIGTIFGLLVGVCAIGFSVVFFFSATGHADDGAVLAGNHPRAAETFRQLGEADPALRLPMEIRFALRNKKGLETLLAQQQNPKSPNYRKWLSGDDFIKRFGPTPTQVKAVSDWLTGEGFSVTKRSANGIEFTGAASQAQRTFAVRIAKFGDGSVYANTSDPVIPKRFAGVIGAVRGMDNMIHAVATVHRVAPDSSLAKANPLTVAELAPAELPIQLALAERDSSEVIGNPDTVVGAQAAFGPADLRNFYDETVSAGADGTGSCISIIDDSDFLDTTATTFDGQFGLPILNYTRVIEGSNPGFTVDESESELDVQWAHVSAPGASINFYLGPDLISDVSGAITTIAAA